jgi:hypothetical protein
MYGRYVEKLFHIRPVWSTGRSDVRCITVFNLLGEVCSTEHLVRDTVEIH